eukprot:497024-Rhodomonas_salina.1
MDLLDPEEDAREKIGVKSVRGAALVSKLASPLPRNRGQDSTEQSQPPKDTRLGAQPQRQVQTEKKAGGEEVGLKGGGMEQGQRLDKADTAQDQTGMALEGQDKGGTGLVQTEFGPGQAGTLPVAPAEPRQASSRSALQPSFSQASPSLWLSFLQGGGSGGTGSSSKMQS